MITLDFESLTKEKVISLDSCRLLPLERLISGHSRAAYLYAGIVFKMRWPLAERHIGRIDPVTAYRYARDIVVGGKWPKEVPKSFSDKEMEAAYSMWINDWDTNYPPC